MQYKLYKYRITRDKKPIGPDKQFVLFEKSRGTDAYGEYTDYRGHKDTVLMHVRQFGSDFTDIVGRHATAREITAYDQREDAIERCYISDNDYPYAAFICMPRLGLIACVDGTRISADNAMSRLHSILIYRQDVWFVTEPLREPYDLRKAVRRFRVTEVVFEIFPVNPHTGDLGRKLDESNKLDHIKKLVGRAEGGKDGLQLDGGFLTAVQQLQQSGHSKVGFTGRSLDNKVEVKVPKPTRTRRLSEDEGETVAGESVAVKIVFEGLRLQYPFPQSHVTEVRTVARKFLDSDGDND